LFTFHKHAIANVAFTAIMSNAVFDNNNVDNTTKGGSNEKISNDSFGQPPRKLSTSGDLAVENTTAYNELPFWTRMGCTPDSFRPRTLADKHNQLNQTLRSRHMHMIAIGKAIVAQSLKFMLTEPKEDQLVQASLSDLEEHWLQEVPRHC
jgi:hypothetical protein